MTVLLDTGSVWIQIGDSTFQNPDPDAVCDTTNRFNPEQSSSIKITSATMKQQYIYMDNPMYGTISYETITLENIAYSGMMFGLMQKCTNGATVGLAYGDNTNDCKKSTDGTCHSFRDNAYKANLIPENMFALAYDKSTMTGNFYLGGFDADIVGTRAPQWCNVVKGQWNWKCQLSTVSGVTIVSPGTILFDSGTNNVSFPGNSKDSVLSEFGGVGCTSSGGFTTCPCNSSTVFKPISLNVSGIDLAIPPNSLLYSKTTKSCKFYFSFGSDNVMVVGGGFYFTYHTIFDRTNSKIGFVSYNK